MLTRIIHFSDAPSDGSQYARQDAGWSVVDAGGASAGDDTDITGLLHGDGSTLSAATAAEVRAAADLDTTDSPTFDGLTLTSDINLSDGASITSAGSLTLGADGDAIEFSGGFGGIKLNGSDQFTFQQLGSTEFIIGGAAGHQSNRGIFPNGGAHDLGLTGSRWGTAYLTDIDLAGDINLSDGATIDIGGGTGTLTIDGDLDITGGVTHPTQKDIFSVVNPSNVEVHRAYADGAAFNYRGIGGAKKFSLQNYNFIGFAHNNAFGNDTGFSATAAGEVSLGNGTSGDASGTLKLADIDASGDINLSDGASITSDGSLTLGADGHTLEFAESGSNAQLNSDVALFVNKAGATQFLFGGGSGNASYRPLYPVTNNSQDLGLSSRRWRTAYLTDIDASGNIDFSGLPTSDPAVAGRLWSDSGTLKVSAG